MHFIEKRKNMLERQIMPWDVSDTKVIQAIDSIPREVFVPSKFKEVAYSDLSIPISEDQNMMEPKVLAKSLQALSLKDSDELLIIGSGTGYTSAVASHLCHKVKSLEISTQLYEAAKHNLSLCKINNVDLECTDFIQYQDYGKYDAVFVAGSIKTLNEQIIKFAKKPSKIFAIVNEQPLMQACLFSVDGNGMLEKKVVFETMLDSLIMPTTNFVF